LKLALVSINQVSDFTVIELLAVLIILEVLAMISETLTVNAEEYDNC